MHARTSQVAVLSLALCAAACGSVDIENSQDMVSPEQQPVELAGDLAAAGAQKGISQAIGDAINGIAQSGASGNASSNMAPPSAVFAEAESAATAPAYAPLNNDQSADLSGWEGPIEGPDGGQGWYRRTWTYSYLDTQADPVTETTDTYSYWFRTEPESDFTDGGWSNVTASVIHYGWTADSGIWGGSTWLMDLHFVQPTQNGQGQTVPSAIAGSWRWWVDAGSTHYANTIGNGQFRYGFSNQDEGLHGFQEALTGETLQSMAVGDTLGYRTDVTSSWQFDILVYGYDNAEIVDVFGGGTGAFDIALDVTRESETSYYLGFAFAGSATSYVGLGDPLSEVDYFQQPAFAEDVTPPGDLWGAGYSQGDLGEPSATRDGLMYWSTYLYDINSTSRTGIGENTSRSYSRSLTLTYTGARYASTSCSSADVAPDCPDNP